MLGSLLARMRAPPAGPLLRGHPLVAARSFASREVLRPVTLIPGDGIGPECVAAVTGVLAAAECPIRWERFDRLGKNPLEIQQVITSISTNGVALKGPLFTKAERWSPASRNMQMRKALDLFANVVPIRSNPGVKTRHDCDIDIVVIRENTEGEYTGIEHEVAPGVVQSTKVITEEASLRIANFAFDYAAKNGRKKVSAIHKANIQKLSDGEFLNGCREVSKNYPDIEYEEMIVDNTSMQLAMRPEQFDVMITPNLYGTIVTNIASGLVGGPGMLPGANYGGRGQAIFESGARHVALDIEGANRANPIGTLRAAVMMLEHIGMHQQAANISNAIEATLEQGVLTLDLGGTATTQDLTCAVIQNLSVSDSDSD
eukprot:TRINITY_DN3864_c0_g1_i2.p1 TRINITY_DN3864_c0_g1~~TRINITY_DN3864_c0_g1_i2.p1  ORF type:complete len:388 (-),score=92.57 TRINITY_DN3864_c0_g1_i2:389-1504(-)